MLYRQEGHANRKSQQDNMNDSKEIAVMDSTITNTG